MLSLLAKVSLAHVRCKSGEVIILDNHNSHNSCSPKDNNCGGRHDKEGKTIKLSSFNHRIQSANIKSTSNCLSQSITSNDHAHTIAHLIPQATSLSSKLIFVDRLLSFTINFECTKGKSVCVRERKLIC